MEVTEQMYYNLEKFLHTHTLEKTEFISKVYSRTT